MLVSWRGGVLVIAGEIDMDTAEAFGLALDAAEVDNQVTVHMAGTSFIDSSGLKELIRKVRQGVRVTILSPSHAVRRTLHVAGLDDYLTIED